jgi:DtxR family Mn-dependent transcriptional regulator
MPTLLIISIATVLLLLLAVWFFFPRRGLQARIQASRAAAHREKVEDTLKYLLDRQQEGKFPHFDSLPAGLGIPPAEFRRLKEGMENQGLVRSDAGVLRLTPTGERMALQIIRAHRLWERYLATEARLPLEKIHTEAHRLEHRFSEAEVNRLDAALGYPLYDPHGDPIPNPAGEFPAEPAAVSLTAWTSGLPGRVVHLEDEPLLAYQQLLAEGLKLGQHLRVLEATPERYLVTDGENEYRLAPAVAANVFLAAFKEPVVLEKDILPLADLHDGQKAEVVNIDEACQGFTRRRFLDLGLTPGTLVYPELSNFFGDPRAYRVRGTLIALRHDQASLIHVRLNAAR